MTDPARFSVGIPFLYPEYWTGGVYYIKNLVSSLLLLPEPEQPMIWMLCDTEELFTFVRDETAYPHLDWIPAAKIGDNDQSLHLDAIFPFPISTTIPQTACWIPDFQEKHLPEFFTAEEIQFREQQHRHYFENFSHMVFSSRAALADFDRWYPEARTNRHVLHFAVFERTPEPAEHEAVLQKYGLPARFFYCPNQFWIHKNHTTVIKAVEHLMTEGVETTVVFSGREYDYRAPGLDRQTQGRCRRHRPRSADPLFGLPSPGRPAGHSPAGLLHRAALSV